MGEGITSPENGAYDAGTPSRRPGVKWGVPFLRSMAGSLAMPRAAVTPGGIVMRIALVAHHGSPLTPATGPEPMSAAASVAAHARGLAKLGHRVTIYARRDSRGLPGSAILAPRVTVEHVTAGPLAPLSGAELAATVAEFSDQLAQRWCRNVPDVVHAYFWTSGLAARSAARDRDIPLVQTFGTLGVAER